MRDFITLTSLTDEVMIALVNLQFLIFPPSQWTECTLGRTQRNASLITSTIITPKNVEHYAQFDTELQKAPKSENLWNFTNAYKTIQHHLCCHTVNTKICFGPWWSIGVHSLCSCCLRAYYSCGASETASGDLPSFILRCILLVTRGLFVHRQSQGMLQGDTLMSPSSERVI